MFLLITNRNQRLLLPLDLQLHPSKDIHKTCRTDHSQDSKSVFQYYFYMHFVKDWIDDKEL